MGKIKSPLLRREGFAFSLVSLSKITTPIITQNMPRLIGKVIFSFRKRSAKILANAGPVANTEDDTEVPILSRLIK